MSLPLDQNVAHLILAAGASSRMGEKIKQLLAWKHTSLIGWEIEKSFQLGNVDTYIVLGAYNQIIADEISELGATIVYNKDWKLGMGSSISCGIDHIKHKNFNSVLITLIDQPLIDCDHLSLLIQLSAEYPTQIIATDMGTKLGVPAIFPQIFFNELIALQEDYGARYIINKRKDSIISIDGANKIVDIDTMDKYEVLKQSERSRDFR